MTDLQGLLMSIKVILIVSNLFQQLLNPFMFCHFHDYRQFLAHDYAVS